MKHKRALFWRCLIYGAGVIFMAVGLTLNTKTRLGVGAVASIAYSGSLAWGMDYGRLTFLVYMAAILFQLLLKKENRNWKICLQLPFSAVFSTLLTLFDQYIQLSPTALWQRLLMLLTAIGITALGLLLMVDMKLIANPADALADTVGDLLGKDVGLGKNVIDAVSVAIACAIGLAASGKPLGIGVGTVAAMLLTGRLVSFSAPFWKKKSRHWPVSASRRRGLNKIRIRVCQAQA